MKKKAQHHKVKSTDHIKSKRHWWVLISIIGVASLGIFLWQMKSRNASTAFSKSVELPSTANTLTSSNIHRLIGRWERTDSNGGYTLEIKSANADGKLEASYFNPNPIKIGRAEWLKKNENLVIVVELRDVNYPGSTYTLQFSSSQDRLIGNYFQAVEGSNYDVDFTRIQ